MLNALVTGTPDLWNAPPEIHSSTVLSFVFAVTLVLAFFTLVLGLIAASQREKGAVWVLVAFVVFAVIATVSMTAMNHDRDVANEKRDVVISAYADEVSDWLDDSYGINVSDDALWRLIDGETLATDYDGDRIVISFTTTSDDELALVDENLALVPELNR